MLKIKNKIRKILFSNRSQKFIDCFYHIYIKIKYPNNLIKKCSFGNQNPSITFYVIRPRTDKVEGLMSLFFYVINNLHYALGKGYIPVVDFENYSTQYSDEGKKGKNVWEYYFTQPSQFTLQDVYNSKNVILSGLEVGSYRPDILSKTYENDKLEQLHNFIFDNIGFSKNVLEEVQIEIDNLNLNFKNTLGLYLRGTDYIALKPSGHPIQPTVEQAVEIVDRFLSIYNIEKIFLVTEDGDIYKSIKERYKEKCTTILNDRFVINYSGKEFLSHDKGINDLGNSPYKRGLNYLVKLIILSKCFYFVGGDTLGAWAACLFKGENFIDKYIFKLGLYGK